MRRTQIYLTEEQDRILTERARASRVSKAALIRQALDAALGIDGGGEGRRQVIRSTSGILADAPDWPEWLASVRGRSADERLTQLGL